MNNKKYDIDCKLTNHITKLILEDYFNNNLLTYQQKFINISIESQKYKSEVESLLKYFNKIKQTYNNKKLVSIIFSYFAFKIVFYYYQDTLFDVSIYLRDKCFSKDNIIRKEEFIILEASLNSSILSKTLEEGSQIKQLIFLNYDDVINIPIFHISFSANTLSIDWFEMKRKYNNDYLKYYFKILVELWSALILRLNHLDSNDEFTVDILKCLLIYCKGPFFCWKLSFSKVVINIRIDEIRYIIPNVWSKEFFGSSNKIKDMYNSLSKVYDVEFENVTYEDLFINGF